MSNDVLEIAVRAEVDGVKLEVYNAVPFRIRRFEMFPTYGVFPALLIPILKVVAEFVPAVVETFLPKKYEFATGSLQKMIYYTSELAQSSANQKQELAEKRSEELRREREQTLAQVADEQTALKYALDCFLLLQTELYKNFPESKIELP